MKLYISIFVIVMWLASCTGSQHIQNSQQDAPEVVDNGYTQTLAKNSTQSKNGLQPNKDKPSNLSLADMLRRLPGVRVMGSGNNVRVQIDGVSSFSSSTEPLYVLNGVSIGTNYAQVASTINPNEISSINVLKGPDATIYGTRGTNGVIVIRTKKK